MNRHLGVVSPIEACRLAQVRPINDDADIRETLDHAIDATFTKPTRGKNEAINHHDIHSHLPALQLCQTRNHANRRLPMVL
ncbi:MAG: hypothetical protein B7X35_01005 [Halothiobacillus sp. 14-56-357]|jgi:hypothetical protein|uniref:CbbQ/NirQ/NorQ domain-containing protein n=1 Tax=Halothiobacillus sp. 15-55-196 TaxID=1970382 RepID=UPI000BCAC75E|nr:CbbQ/NirQ/NorQ C-terminal domain-containing protein [Halothiobacillus sp. 15-55-196]OZB35673.1 MAG: hypothetical protein B7X44_08975 [Halothiobacillus sp. 15-55-196]OZB57458.1 MAG: hypothetical protein B7X35_01005 [Halothiobacillus sp. 14-56-357]OZB79393.1 MAG: hypothetical protein B7X29_01050 [Halothiobacillus sp. 13-55-115]